MKLRPHREGFATSEEAHEVSRLALKTKDLGFQLARSLVMRVLGFVTPDERARLVVELLASLEPDVPGQRHSDAEWLQEIERRARAAMAGNPGVSWKEADEQIPQSNRDPRP